MFDKVKLDPPNATLNSEVALYGYSQHWSSAGLREPVWLHSLVYADSSRGYVPAARISRAKLMSTHFASVGILYGQSFSSFSVLFSKPLESFCSRWEWYSSSCPLVPTLAPWWCTWDLPGALAHKARQYPPTMAWWCSWCMMCSRYPLLIAANGF